MQQPDENKQAPAVDETPDIYPLDEAAITLLAELKTNIEVLNAQWNGALILFIRQHKLAGNWMVASNGRELIRQGPRTLEEPK